jgi:hypothetical protein
MQAGRRWYKLGVVGGLAALIVLAVALVPGAQARASYVNCGNKKITIQVEDGEGGTRPYKVDTKVIQVKNLTCADGVNFIREVMEGSNPGKYGYPQNFKCKAGSFTVPTGFYPQICTRGSKGIKWGQQGG